MTKITGVLLRNKRLISVFDPEEVTKLFLDKEKACRGFQLMDMRVIFQVEEFSERK